MEYKNKGGRPKKTEEEKRSVNVVFRVTPSEKSTLTKRAKHKGLSESDFMRDLILTPPSHSEDSQYYKILPRINVIQHYMLDKEEHEGVDVDEYLNKQLGDLYTDLVNAISPKI